jgi:hypothetical protein
VFLGPSVTFASVVSAPIRRRVTAELIAAGSAAAIRTAPAMPARTPSRRMWWSGAVLTPILATDDPYEAAAVFVKAGWSLVGHANAGICQTGPGATTHHVNAGP